MGTSPKIIVTHVNPDWDAIASVWLLKRYAPGFDDARTLLTSTGKPDPDLLLSADAIVDTGGAYNPSTLRFDHHQLDDATQSAASLVYDWLCTAVHPGGAAQHLAPLVELIRQGDTGHPGAQPSRELGIHALLWGVKSQGWSDYTVLAFAWGILDTLEIQLRQRFNARTSLAEHIVYTSHDGRLVAIKNGTHAMRIAAYEAGAELVLLHYTTAETVAVELWRREQMAEPHVGQVVDCAIGSQAIMWSNPELRAELSTWYRHGHGFYSGRGSSKAPDPRPLRVSVADIAQALDRAWDRSA